MIEALGKHLKNEVPRLEAVHFDWPEPNQILKFPSITLMTLAPTFNNEMPYVLSLGVELNNKSDNLYVVGNYEYKLQLDLWCRSKQERFLAYSEIFKALNPTIAPMGLSLQLKDYYDLWCRYDFVGHSFEDGEIGSQRNEWRVKLNLLANCKAVLDKREYIIDTNEINLTTPDIIEEP